ncbi:MAG: hypothetical protein PUC47_08180 [Oscillospiraceae bacterium]|nr:hypothetical protein [Oscillospiraceae bacterium]
MDPHGGLSSREGIEIKSENCAFYQQPSGILEFAERMCYHDYDFPYRGATASLRRQIASAAMKRGEEKLESDK